MEVAKDGVVRIPKAVFETLPTESAPSSTKSSAPAAADPRNVTYVTRIDGTVDEVIVGAPPNNPNFAPRQCWPGGKIVTNDKLEVKLKFYERKGIPLTPDLLAKKAEMEAAEKAEAEQLKARAAKFGTGNGAKGSAKGKGKHASSTSGSGGSSNSAGAQAAVPAKASNVAAPPKAAPETSAWYKNRPKGGVKVLGGAEGAVTGGKRAAEDVPAESRPAKQPSV